MPTRKFSFDKIKSLIFKQNKKERVDKMIFTLARPSVPGFSYLHLFKEEYWSQIANFLKSSPTVFAVVSFAIDNIQSFNENNIKPDVRDPTQMIYIEVGEISEKPRRNMASWDGDEDESLEEFQERLRLYEAEKVKWKSVNEFLIAIWREDYMHNYKFV